MPPPHSCFIPQSSKASVFKCCLLFSWTLIYCIGVQNCDACSTRSESGAASPRPSSQDLPTDPPPRRSHPTKPPQWYAKPVGAEIRFVIMGDMGGLDEPPYTTYDQLAVAEAVGIVADSFQPDFIVELGDNFYEHGVKHVKDKRFRLTFENVYTAESLLKTPWYIVPGNHDYEGNITAQIEYSEISMRWNFPSLYYSKEFRISDSPRSDLFLIVIDTMLLCGLGNKTLPGSPPTGPWNVTAAENHWTWLEQQLNETKRASYVVVAGHYPVWSVGAHGPTECLKQRLEPLLKKFNVSAYLAGHDHSLQHIHEPGSPVEYFVSGAGAQIDPAKTHRHSVPPDWQLFHMGEIPRKGGFLYAEATPEHLTVAFTDAKDVWDLHTTTISPRRTEE
ncbi:tartrate-resistant acid phosphatase type 5-like [Diadema setosum]|uniref:tartrate-resistant acid phosphatase type 5-like n=1 Tax=Diadema setosum TaxID=31175 RepID=UPI003B3B329C